MQLIETNTLRLEPLVAAHAEEMFQPMSAPAIYEFIAERPPISLSSLRRRYRQLERGRSADGRQLWLSWVVRVASGQCAGYVQATIFPGHTGDLAFVRGIWPNVERALAWMDGPGDPDGDGLLEYERRTPSGLIHQGWKDSHDSIFHADGSLADGPIAMSEIQAYAYAARSGAAELADALEQPERAAELRAQAAALRQRFEDAFWLEDLGTYALALDGHKRPTRVRTSNAGHCLASGIASPERAARVAETLMDEASFSGWGVRTVAAGERRYNPMSYHNGSIWPHDSAMVAMGLGRYGHHDHAARILTGLFEASRHFDLMRLPELFCGFTRRDGEAPTLYPVACSPQAWASGAPFMVLQACLGLEIAPQQQTVRFNHARLPAFVDHLTIENLPVGEARIDLRIERQRTGVGLNILGRRGDVEVVTIK